MTSDHLRLVHSSDVSAIDLPDDFLIPEIPANVREELDNIWQEPEETYQVAWVCSLLDLEAWKGLRFKTPEQILGAIKFINKARHRYYLEHVAETPFEAPTLLALRLSRLLYEKTEVVMESCADMADLFNCNDEDSLLDTLGRYRIWWRVRDEAQRAIARSIRLMDPSIDRWTSDTQIAPIVEVILRMRRYDPYVSYNLHEIDELLRSET
ncbi:hypothetical protein [Bradyrhizobium mercantei]|uniref:hypothetical protein n=1 Tax=Bradyrhizobium mercantei TaxID=1904807 RepID=UPI000976B472|nr:hypothetical protein [Bradyrhizobium mercantei]